MDPFWTICSLIAVSLITVILLLEPQRSRTRNTVIGCLLGAADAFLALARQGSAIDRLDFAFALLMVCIIGLWLISQIVLAVKKLAADKPWRDFRLRGYRQK